MGYTMYNAEWLIEAQKPDGTLIEQLAYCKSFACAEAAYDAAVRTRPYEHIVFRHGARLLRKYEGKWTAEKARAPKDAG
jgi:hypothetical protein